MSRSSYSKDSEGSWFRSLFVHKVDPRKDAHSTLLSKKETSSLYKIQCEWPLHPPARSPHRLQLGEEGLGTLSCPGHPGPVGLPLPELPKDTRTPCFTSHSVLSLQFTT